MRDINKAIRSRVEEEVNKSVYYQLARNALWIISLVLVGVFVIAVWDALRGDQARVSQIISAAQVLSFIAVSVLGYRLHRGGRLMAMTDTDPPTS